MQKAACLQSVNSTPLAVIFYGDCRERFPTLGAISKLKFYLNQPPTNQQTKHVATISPSTTQTTGAISTERVSKGQSRYKQTSEETRIALAREACKDIHCDFEATCEIGPDNFPRCTCQFDCATAALREKSLAVCASDMRLYPSICAMKMEACQRQEELRLRPLDLCQGLLNTVLI